MKVDNVTCEFGGVRALRGASFNVGRGRITGLMGPNGAGKSTIINVIAGAIRPDSGSVVFDGVDVTGAQSHEMARKGVIRTFQLASEFAGLSVMENLLVGDFHMKGERTWDVVRGKRYWSGDQEEAVGRARDLLDRFNMREKENDLAGLLSGGQKRILELLRALMARPRLIVLDEPMAGVHPRIVDSIIGCLQALRMDGVSVLMTEHELGVIERACDPVIVMADGQVISEGTIAEVRARPEVLDAYLVR